MHSAPPALVPVGRFVWGPRIHKVLALSSALVLGSVGLTSGIAAPQAAFALAIWCAAWLLSYRWMASDILPPGQLHWDGQEWRFESGHDEPVVVDVHVLLDLGSAMLVSVRLTPAQGILQRPQCAWLSARQLPAQWHGWRCAVYGRDIL